MSAHVLFNSLNEMRKMEKNARFVEHFIFFRNDREFDRGLADVSVSENHV